MKVVIPANALCFDWHLTLGYAPHPERRAATLPILWISLKLLNKSQVNYLSLSILGKVGFFVVSLSENENKEYQCFHFTPKTKVKQRVIFILKLQ
jgi:hypothetical protein